MNTNQLDKLHEFDFWSMINNIKWGDCITKCIAAKRYIMHNFPPYKTNVFRRIADSYARQLVDKYMADSNTTFSYTQVYNGAYEVISHGKTSYNSFVSDPSLLTPIIEYIVGKDEDEKFVYSMPLEDDFFNQEIL